MNGLPFGQAASTCKDKSTFHVAGPQTLESIKRIEPVRHVFSQSFALGSEGMVTGSERSCLRLFPYAR